MLMAPCGPQVSMDRAISSSFKNASDPANSVPPARKPARPAPEPTEAYCTCTLGCCEENAVVQAFIAEFCALEPPPVNVPWRVDLLDSAALRCSSPNG